MNYLITGGCGFIGSHVLSQLKKQGHNPVCYDLHPNNTSIQQVLSPDEIRKITVVEGGLDDKGFLTKIMRENNINVVLHLAALLGTDSEKDRAAAVNTNILGTINVFEAAIEAGIKRVVWASSQAIFGTEEFYRQLYHTDLVPNDALLKPKLVYGATKVFKEFLGEWYYENFGLETIGLRFATVFGIARMRGSGQFATNLINNPAAGIPGVVDYGDTVPCWLYVKDAARAAILAGQCPVPQTRSFIIGGDITPVSEVRKYVLSLLPEAQIKLNPGVYPSASNLDISAAERELGFKCEYSVFEGVRETINLIRQSRNLPPV